MNELILHCYTATEGCVSIDFFRHSLDDSPASLFDIVGPAHPWITVELIVIHNSPCEHSSTKKEKEKEMKENGKKKVAKGQLGCHTFRNPKSNPYISPIG